MVYKNTILIVFLLLITPIKLSSHSFYVSVCNVYEKEQKTFFSIRVFKDDVFDALKIRKSSADLLVIDKEKIKRYVLDNFIVKVNEKDKKLNVERLTFEGNDYTETLNLVFSLKESLVDKNLGITNTVLLESIDDQTNVVGVKINNTKKTLTYSKNKKEGWVKII